MWEHGIHMEKRRGRFKPQLKLQNIVSILWFVMGYRLLCSMYLLDIGQKSEERFKMKRSVSEI
jgi:hypothetical protein